MNRTRSAALLLACMGVSGAEAAGGAWVADANSGCKVWNPHPQADETIVWEGACANGLADGDGTLRWLRAGVVAETDRGRWSHGHQTGRAMQEWSGGRYEGDVADGLPHGLGVMVLQERRYSGAFVDGKPNGAGTATIDGTTFQGTWRDGCLDDGKRKISFGVPLATCK